MSLDNFILECEKDNKELEDTIKVLKNKIQRLTREIKELKSTLRGTTHCFDEEEHNKLKKENQTLKKHLKIPKTCNLKTLEDYKSYYEDTTREQILEDTYIEYCAYVNLAHRYSKLKKQLEEWEHHLKCSKEMLDIQGQKGNYDYDEYMLGLYNGMEYIIALFETREPNFINGKDVEFTNNKIQQKKFIKWLEDYINLFDKKDIYEEGSCDTIEEILNKYKEIIGVSDENTIK